MSLMRKHQQASVGKKQISKKATANTELYKAEYKKWLGKLHADQNGVKALTDHSDRNAKAADVLDAYLEYLRSWIAAGVAHQNDVLTQCVVWAVDGERWDVLFELADPAIANPKVGNLHWMDRPLPQFVADQLLKSLKVEACTDLAELKTPVREVLERIEDGRWPVNHISHARYCKEIGLLTEAAEDWETTVKLFTKADELYENIAVKTRLKTAIAQLSRASEEPDTENLPADDENLPADDENLPAEAEGTTDLTPPKRPSEEE